jgi:urease accessory protein
MIIYSKCIAGGRGIAKPILQRAAVITLDWDTRQKSRFESTDSKGQSVGIFLPRGQVVRGGDLLVGEDGSFLRVEAAPQPVLKITHCPHHGTVFDLTRAAYHLGNRHVPIELQADHLKIEPDHVLKEMLESMHLIVHSVDESFEPENGAYGEHHAGHSGHTHSAHAEHGHGHKHNHHEHDHSHDHGHEHTHDHSHEHR